MIYFQNKWRGERKKRQEKSYQYARYGCGRHTGLMWRDYVKTVGACQVTYCTVPSKTPSYALEKPGQPSIETRSAGHLSTGTFFFGGGER